ncbi:MAG: carboxypeptidase regulatory-like domain-containing protein [Cyanobacteria bacterium J06639_14]
MTRVKQRGFRPNRWLWGIVTVGTAVGYAPSVIAHGVSIQHQMTREVKIQAVYDSGEPMAEAQVSVYAPDAPQTPWTTGKTNEQGEFEFAPDITLEGDWEVQVRQAGHGDIVTIPITSTAETTMQASVVQASGGHTPAQLILMGAAGIWGFVGTALFFSRRSA